jgi:mRNA-degrading endonuclease YafQ of YafQ-DinJ toxin-antitoxin module
MPADMAPNSDCVGHRECRIGGDFLLAYRIENQGKATQQVVFVRAGGDSR